MKKTLNVVMIVKNEEACLRNCLNRVKALADEIIIVDTGSKDRTREIAGSFTRNVFDFTWKDDFSAARNYGLDQSDADWNLILDADELLTEGSREELEPYLEMPDHLGAVKICNYYEDGKEINCGIDYTTRLLPKGVRFQGRIHEQADSDLRRIPIPLALEHKGYLKKGKGQRNLPILLKELEDHPGDPYYLYHVASILKNTDEEEAVRYFEEFLKYVPGDANYRRKGVSAYLDTLMHIKKFDHALKLLEAERINYSTYADFQFLCGVFYMNLVLSDVKKYIAYLPEIERSYLRCLEIGEDPKVNKIDGTGSFKAAYNLGVWYEVSGNTQLAMQYYTQSAKQGWQAAINRLKELDRK